MLEPKSVIICDKEFILSKFPAMEGRRIITQYGVTAAPKIGNYEDNEKLTIQLMSYVGIPREGLEPLRLATRQLINSHMKDWVMLMTVEKEMMVYNFENFPTGRILDFLKESAKNFLPKITSMLTDSSQQSSMKEKQL